MKGLILKEYFSVKNYIKQYIFIAAIFMVVGIMMKYPGYAAFMLIIVALTMTISGFSTDEYYHWDTFAASLPLSRSDIIKAKYGFMLLMFVAAAAAGAILTAAGALILDLPIGQNVLFSLAGCLAIPLMGGIVIPVVIKFGAEKGRIIFIAIMLIPAMLIYMGAKTIDEQVFLSWVNKIAGMPNRNLIFGIAILCVVAAVNLISYVLSVKFYKQKEF